ncbi:MAG: hypothetical protein IPN77_29105 [Sandaracinaceae bacterium]|nr:hypothetical protein [Sandaracinaceae bacterium]
MVAILESAQARVARSVNSTHVVANWLVGREIVEGEQAGARKGEYGERLIETLSEALSVRFGRGYSATNLRWFRQFYLEYPMLLSTHHALGDEFPLPGTPVASSIHHAASDESPSAVGALNLDLSWTHYRLLLKVDRAPARSFYELEEWSPSWTEGLRVANACPHVFATQAWLGGGAVHSRPWRSVHLSLSGARAENRGSVGGGRRSSARLLVFDGA